VAVDIFRERVFLRSEEHGSRIIPLVQLQEEVESLGEVLLTAESRSRLALAAESVAVIDDVAAAGDVADGVALAEEGPSIAGPGAPGSGGQPALGPTGHPHRRRRRRHRGGGGSGGGGGAGGQGGGGPV
jgi:hypothetical protein